MPTRATADESGVDEAEGVDVGGVDDDVDVGEGEGPPGEVWVPQEVARAIVTVATTIVLRIPRRTGVPPDLWCRAVPTWWRRCDVKEPLAVPTRCSPRRNLGGTSWRLGHLTVA